MYYKTCQNCGANLDPCEICDCMKSNKTILTPAHSEHRSNHQIISELARGERSNDKHFFKDIPAEATAQ